MRFAIAALMAVLLAGTILAQDATSAQDKPNAQDAQGVQDATQSAAAESAAKAPAPDAPKNPFSFRGGITLGSDVFLSGAPIAPSIAPSSETWTRLGFQPDLGFGKFGVGFDLSFHFMLYPDQDTSFKLYRGDWVPEGDQSVLDVYLPKILYVRYGIKGEDPFFAKLGSINDLSLGNGFIMSDYSNMLFMPQQRIFGLDLGLDGALFKFPYVGLEAITGNLARFDVVGGRLFVRPLAGTAVPILKDMQVGATAVADTKPDLYAATATAASPVSAYGADILVPILGGKALSLAAFTDLAFDPNASRGWMVGFGGRLLGIFTYGGQLRILQDGFIPSYFDANYDIYRAKRFDAMQKDPGSGSSASWYATIGTSLIADKLVLRATLDGPFKMRGVAADPGAASQTDYPHLRGVFGLGEIEGIPFFFDASYEKYLIGAVSGFFPDLVDPTDAVIGLDVNYKTGASVLTLAYNAKWDPAQGRFDVTSSLQASMKF